MLKISPLSIPYILLVFLGTLCFSTCKNKSNNISISTNQEPFIIRGADLSFLPEMEAEPVVFLNQDSIPENVLQTLKNKGMNTVRIRIWHTPSNAHSSINEVKLLAQKVKAMNLKVWLCVHYSDTWADPSQQATPKAWQGLSLIDLKDSVYQYTQLLLNEIKPDFIQIGNELNSGMLLPTGNRSTQEANFVSLLQTGCKAVRDYEKHIPIIIHYAGYSGSVYFYQSLQALDFDYIGLSYYPVWHGRSLVSLDSAMNELSATFNKPILIAETAYPFALGWNDYTNNIVGLESQLILPEYPATPLGQKDFLQAINKLTSAAPKRIGFCYWGAEYVAYKGPTASNGSPWENQALYNFHNKATLAIDAFGKN